MSERGTGTPRGMLVYTENNYMPGEWWLQLAFYKINYPLLAKLDNIFRRGRVCSGWYGRRQDNIFKVLFELVVVRD